MKEHHKVEITDNALEAAVKLSSRYINDRFLPDKAIDLLDEQRPRYSLPAIRHRRGSFRQKIISVVSMQPRRRP